MITASCLCDGVRLRLTGRLGPAAFCHCSQCRKANGSAFACNAPLRARYLEFERGRDLIREFESSPGKFRAFCSRCGSPIYSRVSADPESFRIRMGIIDDDPERRPLFHVWVGSKAPWFEITDALPRFDSVPSDADPSVGNPVLEVAILKLRSGEARAFEAAFLEAERIISTSSGYRRHELRRCIEAPDQYLLLVWWDSLESHTEGFRRSPGYQRWRELLHRFYEPFPEVEHYVAVAGASA
jgi:heme-degrading monooxygenase HmoA